MYDEYQKHLNDFSSDISDDSDILEEQIQYNIEENKTPPITQHNKVDLNKKTKEKLKNENYSYNHKNNNKKNSYQNQNQQKIYEQDYYYENDNYYKSNYDNTKHKGGFIKKKKYDYKSNEVDSNYKYSNNYNKQKQFYTIEKEITEDIYKCKQNVEKINKNFAENNNGNNNYKNAFKNKYDDISNPNTIINNNINIQSNQDNFNINKFLDKLNFNAKEFIPKRKTNEI